MILYETLSCLRNTQISLFRTSAKTLEPQRHWVTDIYGMRTLLKNLYTFASSVVRMNLVSKATGAVVAADVVMTEVITCPIFIVFISTLVYICGRLEYTVMNEAPVGTI